MSIKTTHKNESESAAEDALKTMRKLSEGEDLSEDEQNSVDQATQRLQNKSSAVANKPMNRAQKRAAQKLANKQARDGSSGGRPSSGRSQRPPGQNNRTTQRRETSGLSEEEAQEMSPDEIQNHLIEQLHKQGQGSFNKTLSAQRKATIHEVYDSFETPDENNDDWSSEDAAKKLIEEFANNDIPAELISNQHRRAKFGLNKTDNAQVVIARYHGPVVARSGDDKYILSDLFEELIVPKSAIPKEESTEEEGKKTKKSLFRKKKQK